jgi:hypothetical protein
MRETGLSVCVSVVFSEISLRYLVNWLTENHILEALYESASVHAELIKRSP